MLFTNCARKLLLHRSIRSLNFYSNMATTHPPFLQVLAASVTAVNKAGDLIRDIMAGGKLDIVEKENANDLQTKADRMANDLLCGSLKTAFPKMAVIGEESGEVSLSQIKVDNVIKDLGDQNVIEHFASKLPDHVAKANFEDFTIWVDPLDGTKEYTEGYLDHVTVLVGIAVGKKAIGGIIHQPFWNYQSQEPDKKLGRTFYGVGGAGIGGHLNPQEPPSGERIVTSTRSHSTGLVGQ